jgi:hypothetical protein
MRYRTKFVVLLSSLVLFSSGTMFLMLYVQARGYILGEMHSQATSIAATTARMLNGDALATLKSRRDENSVAYRTLEKTLREVRDANRRNDVRVEHVYTLMRVPENGQELRFVVDSEQNPKFKSHVGDIYVTGSQSGLSQHLDRPYSPPGFGAQGWAKWVSGHAPVYDRNGRFVGAVGVGVSAEGALRELNRYLVGGLILLVVSTIASIFASLHLARRLAEESRTSRTWNTPTTEGTSGPLRRAA